MQLPIRISFHGMDASPAVESRIHELAAKLEQFHDRITRCDVAVEQPHHRHQKGNQWHVRIDMTVPGHEIVVSHDPGKDEDHEDVYVALRDAFAAARRQLEDYVHKQRDQRPPGGVS